MIDWVQAVTDTLHDRDKTSHRELNPAVFHPSFLGACKRQMFLRKLGLTAPNTESLGTFRGGSMIHKFMEDEVSKHVPDRLKFETSVKGTIDGITITGRADCFDPKEGIVYDFKSRGGRNLPSESRLLKDKYMDQLMVYMELLGADRAQLIYLSKGCLQVKHVPSDSFVEYSEDRMSRILEKAQEVKSVCSGFVEAPGFDGGNFRLKMDKLKEEGVPFDRCGDCWSCRKYERKIEELR